MNSKSGNDLSGNNIRHIPTHNDYQDFQIFKLFYQNVRSLLNKVDELLLCIAGKNFNVLCISEHWLDSATMKILCLSGYVLGSVFCRSDSRGGGVAIFLGSGLEHREVCVVSDFTVPKCAEITCTYINKFDLNIITLYRPPSANFEIFIEKIEGAITALGHEKRVLLVGDFNVLFNTDDRGAARLTDLLGTYGFSSQVHTSTRGNNCLDNIFTNFLLDSSELVVCDNGLSDHKAFELQLPIESTNTIEKQTYQIHRPLTEEGKHKFYNMLEVCSWSFLNNDEISTDNKWDSFCSTLKLFIETCFPEKRYRLRNSNALLPWFNDELRQKREQLHFLCDLCSQYPSTERSRHLSRYRSHYKIAIQTAKKNYNDNYISRSRNKSKGVWDIINNNRSSKKRVTKTNCTITPDEFNCYFTRVAESLLEGSASADDVPFRPEWDVSASFAFREVTYIELRDVIRNLKNKKSRDTFGMTVELLKITRELLLAPLTKLINLSLMEKIFPSCLKGAIVVPIFKKGDKSNLSNYRPIFLLPVLSKVIEKCMAIQIASFLEDNSMLSPDQFGFREGRSTVQAILNLVSAILEGYENKEHTVTVFCDLSKAFDCVSHNLLLRKLSYYGFDRNSIALLTSYLSGRSQCVSLNGKSSKRETIRTGVPQGSVLGPLLFLLYINNLTSIAHDEKYILFADDTTFSVRNVDLNAAAEASQAAHTRARVWFEKNNLVLNEDKTSRTVFSLRDTASIPHLNQATRFLGVQLDTELRFDYHIEDIGCGKRSDYVHCLLRPLSFCHVLCCNNLGSLRG